jgi:hypothetical protein
LRAEFEEEATITKNAVAALLRIGGTVAMMRRLRVEQAQMKLRLSRLSGRG